MSPNADYKDAEVPWTQPNGITGTYDLHCHCGAVRAVMTLSPPLEERSDSAERCIAIECDCSFCTRNGSYIVHPLAKDVQFTRGLEQRSEYRFGRGGSVHWFCKVCASLMGTDPRETMEAIGMGDMEPRVAINLRMLKDYDRSMFQARRLEMMKSMPPSYEDHIDALYADDKA